MFKTDKPFDKRKEDSDRIRSKYPERIPGIFIITVDFPTNPCFIVIVVICEKLENSTIQV
jgi:hypothetical protein